MPHHRSWQRDDIIAFGWSALLHAVLLVPCAIPGYAARHHRDKPVEAELVVQRPSGTGSQDWTWKSHHPPPGKGPCDTKDTAPERYDFDIAGGPLDRAFIAAAHQSHYGVAISEDLLRGRTSRALRGRLHALDAVQLLAGDAGLCVDEWVDPNGDTLWLRKCQNGHVPVSRAMFPALAIGKDPPLRPPCQSTEH